MSTAPRTVGVFADDGMSAGSVFLQQLCRHYPPGKLLKVVLCSNPSAHSNTDWGQTATVRLNHPIETWSWRLGEKWAWLAVFLRHMVIRQVKTAKLSREILRMVAEHRADVVWIVLASPTMIYLARRLVAKVKTRVVVTVWDPPERWATELRMDRVSRARLLRDFAVTMKSANGVGVASENMKEEYLRRFGCAGEVLIHGLATTDHHPAPKGPRTDNQLVIGVAGNLYSATEWYALLNALDSVGWQIAGRQVRIRVLGPDLVLQKRRSCVIEFMGWRPVQEALKLLSETDIAYLPYLFDPAFKSTTRLCFPNKLSTYLAAGLPVLFHGPEDSSPVRFFRRYPVASCCHSLEPRPILDALERLVGEPGFYASAVEAGQRALKEELNLEVFLGRFAATLGCRREDLLRGESAMVRT